MRILINTFGSLGDLFPYLNISDRLMKLGHTVTIATGEQYRERVEKAGLAFRPVRPHFKSDAALLSRVMDEFSGGRYLFRQILFPAVRDSYKDLQAALPGHDILVTHVAALAGPLVARITGIPWISTVLAPLGFFSAADPPVAAMPLLGLSRRAPRLVNFINRCAQRSTNAWAADLYRFETDLGLPPAGNPLLEAQHSPRLVLALFSKHFAAPQEDWPKQVSATGFPYAPPETLPAEVERFLAAGPAPIVFTLGSSAVFAPGKFYEAAQSLGKRAILLAGPLAATIPATSNLLPLEYAPHSAVFPHAAAIVHQAGIGTAAEVLRSGRPSLVVPFAYDQPDNAARLERLGTARVLGRRALNPTRLKRELEALLSNPDYAAAAARVCEQVRSENGAQAAAEAIIQFPGAHPATPQPAETAHSPR